MELGTALFSVDLGNTARTLSWAGLSFSMSTFTEILAPDLGRPIRPVGRVSWQSSYSSRVSDPVYYEYSCTYKIHSLLSAADSIAQNRNYPHSAFFFRILAICCPSFSLLRCL